MGQYSDNPAAIRALVRDGEVHRDVYVDDEVFDLEMRHLFANTWVFIGHDSQVPEAGDYITANIARQPLIMVRHTDDTVRVLYNRCAHKGTQLVCNRAGHTGKYFRCP